jgi:hypothetical protein
MVSVEVGPAQSPPGGVHMDWLSSTDALILGAAIAFTAPLDMPTNPPCT